MASLSKKAKYHAATKRENSLLRRAAIEATKAQGRATALVLGCLVQAGGDITFSPDTTARMNTDISRMGYQITPTPEGLVKVVLVMQEAEPALANDPEGTSHTLTELPEADGKIILTD